MASTVKAAALLAGMCSGSVEPWGDDRYGIPADVWGLAQHVNETTKLGDYEPVGPSAPANVPLPWGPNDCFVNPTWDKKSIVKISKVKFGEANQPFDSVAKKQELYLDVYSPPDSDSRQARPLVVYAFGGAFIVGDRSEAAEFANELVPRGYVVAGFDYRLVPILHITELFNAGPGVIAAEDARAAIRFMRKNAAEYRIDTERIAIMGSSAGAYTAFFVGYAKKLEDGTDILDGLSGNPGYSSHVNYMSSISGGAKTKAFCLEVEASSPYTSSSCLIDPEKGRGVDLGFNVDANDINGMDVHGTKDHIVAYEDGLEAETLANKVGIPHVELLTIPGASHVPVGDLFNPSEEYLVKWLTHLSGGLNLAEAECPSSAEAELVV